MIKVTLTRLSAWLRAKKNQLHSDRIRNRIELASTLIQMITILLSVILIQIPKSSMAHWVLLCLALLALSLFGVSLLFLFLLQSSKSLRLVLVGAAVFTVLVTLVAQDWLTLTSVEPTPYIRPPIPVTPLFTPTGGAVATPTATSTPISPGRLEITYPIEMTVEESDIVAVEVVADPRLAEIGAFPPHVTGIISIETSSQDGGRARIEDKIRLYPVMSVELIAPTFDISCGDTDARRVITTAYPAAWTWTIAARKPGKQEITVNVFGETTVGKDTFIVLEKSKARIITVSEKSLTRRLLDGFANDFGTILGTGGPLGLIIAFLAMRASQTNKRLQERTDSLENRLRELEKAQALSQLQPSPEEEVAYWLVPVKLDDKQASGEDMLTLVMKQRRHGISGLRQGDWICVYATGKGVVAHGRAMPERDGSHRRQARNLTLDEVVLYLNEPTLLSADVRSRLDTFRFRNPKSPWGWFVRSIRKITEHDFRILTRQG